MKKTVRALLAFILSGVCLYGITQILLKLNEYDSADQRNSDAKQIVFDTMWTAPPSHTQETHLPASNPAAETHETTPPEEMFPLDDAAGFLQQVDMDGLRQINPEVLGWIYIPDTAISYPLMQTDDQNKYLNHAWDGTPNGSGSIFLEKRNARDMTDFNTIIYGHHMANGTMFQPLVDYRNADFLASHPYVYVLAGNKIFRYRIFSAYEAPITSHTYRLVFRDDAEKLAAIEHYLQGRTDVELTPQDHILTLSTCTGLGDYSVRWVVQGVLDASWEK